MRWAQPSNAGAVPRKSFQQLMSHPFSRGIFRAPGRANGGRATESRRQIARERTRSETTKKSEETISFIWFGRLSAPGLRGWFPMMHHVLGSRGLELPAKKIPMR
jgi:hypothetical protein